MAEVSGPAEIDAHLLGLGGVENQVVITAPLYQSLGLPLYEVSSFPVMRPSTVVSSANFTMR